MVAAKFDCGKSSATLSRMARVDFSALNFINGVGIPVARSLGLSAGAPWAVGATLPGVRVGVHRGCCVLARRRSDAKSIASAGSEAFTRDRSITLEDTMRKSIRRTLGRARLIGVASVAFVPATQAQADKLRSDVAAATKK